MLTIMEHEIADVMPQVEKGADMLDRVWTGPNDWRDGIDVERLNIESISNCVLGQLYGTYAKGMETLEYQTAQWLGGHELGFCSDDWREAMALNVAWKRFLLDIPTSWEPR